MGKRYNIARTRMATESTYELAHREAIARRARLTEEQRDTEDAALALHDQARARRYLTLLAVKVAIVGFFLCWAFWGLGIAVAFVAGWTVAAHHFLRRPRPEPSAYDEPQTQPIPVVPGRHRQFRT